MIMLRKEYKKGFTLLELIMAISTFAILLTTMTAGFLFISKSNGFSIDKSTASFNLRNIRDYIIDKNINDNTLISYVDNNVYVVDNDESVAIFKDLPFDALVFNFSSSNNINYCSINYTLNDNTSTFKFITSID